MSVFGFRVTPGEYDRAACAARIKVFVRKHAQSWVITEEYGAQCGNFHYQAWASTELNRKKFQQNLRTAVSAYCHNFGTSEFECQDFEAMQRYVMKGSKRGELPVILDSYGIAQFGDDYIQKYHEAYWEENKRLKKLYKEKKVTLYSEMSRYIEGMSEPPTKRGLAEKYVEICHMLDKPIDEYRAKSFLRLMYSKYNPDGKTEVVDKLSDF